MQKQVLPHFDSVPLNRVTNTILRAYVSTLLRSRLFAATSARLFRFTGTSGCCNRGRADPDQSRLGNGSGRKWVVVSGAG
jgi:hypothetical protein